MTEVTREPVASDPHTQVLQSNERTVLSWIRTGLAIMAFGFVVARVGLWLREMDNVHDDANGTVWVGAGFVGLGILTHLVAAKRYVSARKAILEGGAIQPATTMILLVAISLSLLGAALLAYLVAQ